jgi:hypothetical protein
MRFLLANICSQIISWHVVTNVSSLNEPPFCILEIQRIYYDNKIDN